MISNYLGADIILVLTILRIIECATNEQQQPQQQQGDDFIITHYGTERYTPVKMSDTFGNAEQYGAADRYGIGTADRSGSGTAGQYGSGNTGGWTPVRTTEYQIKDSGYFKAEVIPVDLKTGEELNAQPQKDPDNFFVSVGSGYNFDNFNNNKNQQQTKVRANIFVRGNEENQANPESNEVQHAASNHEVIVAPKKLKLKKSPVRKQRKSKITKNKHDGLKNFDKNPKTKWNYDGPPPENHDIKWNDDFNAAPSKTYANKWNDNFQAPSENYNTKWTDNFRAPSENVDTKWNDKFYESSENRNVKTFDAPTANHATKWNDNFPAPSDNYDTKWTDNFQARSENYNTKWNDNYNEPVKGYDTKWNDNFHAPSENHDTKWNDNYNPPSEKFNTKWNDNYNAPSENQNMKIWNDSGEKIKSHDFQWNDNFEKPTKNHDFKWEGNFDMPAKTADFKANNDKTTNDFVELNVSFDKPVNFDKTGAKTTNNNNNKKRDSVTIEKVNIDNPLSSEFDQLFKHSKYFERKIPQAKIKSLDPDRAEISINTSYSTKNEKRYENGKVVSTSNTQPQFSLKDKDPKRGARFSEKPHQYSVQEDPERRNSDMDSSEETKIFITKVRDYPSD